MEKFVLPKRYKDSTPSVWIEFSALDMKYKPLCLAHGNADFAAPLHLTENLAKIAKDDNPLLHQYTRGYGHPRLVQVLTKLYSKLVCRDINPMTEVLISHGAFEALYATIQGHVDNGDEVIIIEPFFDCYEPMVKSAGGIPRFIPLKPNKTEGMITSANWVLDECEFEKLFNAKTKMIILNTPHNPIGKVFERRELEKIAELCKKWNVLCVSDEVYEWLVFDGKEHIRICTLPDMWERTITIGSAGKTFSVTGWKIGWAYGPGNLMTNLQMVHQNSLYCCNTPTQEAIAVAFEIELSRFDSPSCYFKSFCKELATKRDYMVEFLQNAGFKPTIPEGAFFILADWSDLAHKVDLNAEHDKYKDFRFAKWMTKNLGLQVIPPSAFYTESNKHLAENLIRFCFIKKTETLNTAAQILNFFK